MRTSANPLFAQRLLAAGLLVTLALSALLLFLLRTGASRGRMDAAAAGETRSAVARALPDPELAPPEPAPGAAPARARTEFVGEAEDARPEEDPLAFDPGAVFGRVLCAGAGVAEVELRLFRGELGRRERTAPLAETKSDAEGRFRLRGLAPHTRFVLHAQHPDFLPESETLFPGHAAELALERTVAVAGRVRLAASGQALAGVEVALERQHYGPEGMRERVGSLSDAEGRWRLPWAEPGIESFLVLRPGHAPERREFQVRADAGGDYEIELDETRALELEIYALETGATLGETELLWEGLAVRTDESGRLLVPLTPGASMEDPVSLLLGLPEGCTTQFRAVPPPGGRLRLPVARGGTLRGRVLDAAGAPVVGAELRLGGGERLTKELGLPEGVSLNPRRGTTRSGVDGRFELAGQAPRRGQVRLRASHPEHPANSSEPFEFARLGEERELDITLRAGATLTGTLRVDGEPAALRLYWNAHDTSGWTRANDHGAYRLQGLQAGPVSLRPRLEGEDEDIPRAEDREVLAIDDGALVEDFDLARGGARIRGRVLDTRGEPVAGADVTAWVSDEEQWAGALEAECDGEGRFELAVPDVPGLEFELFASSGPRQAQAHAVRAGAELVLVLPELATLRLRVVDALRREPVLGFQLYWRDSEAGEFRRLSQGGRRFSPGPDGTFLAELPAGRLDLAVGARALGYVPARLDGLELAGGREARAELELDLGTELELSLGAGEGSDEVLRLVRRGRVTLATAEQWAERERGGEYFRQEVRDAQTVRVDANGVGRIRALASGRYRLFGLPKGTRTDPRELEVPAVAHLTAALRFVVEPPRKPGRGGD